ncbi:class I SAM-dependent methyltransferase [Niabella aurantiaca]|uniref:class I SAM-dependent methyltransferase n=1 Tax=Niabella aurantiaca TaxID=379900 RepID=UPI00035D1906|nr:class I SAM-dependent methyltransferase [Niabella aurantiaca]
MEEKELMQNIKGNTLPGRDGSYYFESDENFHELYPLPVATLASRHWTPLAVTKKAAAFLATHKGARILDIGCGVGKFCLSAAYFAPCARFYGVEQRKRLLAHAQNARAALRAENVYFLHANFMQLDFGSYDHFYFFNSFYENLEHAHKIDDSIVVSEELFNHYNRILFRQLAQKPGGTRIVTYHSMENEIPPEYYLVESASGNLLKCWIKA